MKEIESFIIQGVRNAYQENKTLKTSYHSFHGDIVEYLITVNIGQELIKWNAANGWNQSISLEFDLNEFLSNAFETTIEWIDIWNSKIIAPATKSLDINDSGRLDIAVFDHEDRSLYPIEVKGINSSYDKITEDVERIAKLVSAVNGEPENSIQAGYCTFMRYLGGEVRISSKDSLKKATDKILSELDDRFKTITQSYNVEFNVHSFEIVSSSKDAITTNVVVESADEAGRETGKVFGVLLVVKKG